MVYSAQVGHASVDFIFKVKIEIVFLKELILCDGYFGIKYMFTQKNANGSDEDGSQTDGTSVIT